MYFLPNCKVATWAGAHSCVGDMYAPDTDFTISGTSHLYGRIVAKSITVTGNGGLHEALPPIGITGSNRAFGLVGDADRGRRRRRRRVRVRSSEISCGLAAGRTRRRGA